MKKVRTFRSSMGDDGIIITGVDNNLNTVFSRVGRQVVEESHGSKDNQ